MRKLIIIYFNNCFCVCGFLFMRNNVVGYFLGIVYYMLVNLYLGDVLFYIFVVVYVFLNKIWVFVIFLMLYF